MDEQIVQGQIAGFRNGLFPSVALILAKDAHPDANAIGGLSQRLSPAQERQLVSAVKRRWQGTHNSGEPLILGWPIADAKKISQSPNEMGWLESGEAVKQRILETFGVSPAICGQLENSNRAAAWAAEHHFADFTCNPLIELLNQSLNEWLVPQFAAPGEKLVVEIEKVIPDDADMALRKMELATTAGVVSANELRAFAGLPETDQWKNTLVGGQNMAGSNPIEQGVRSIAERAVARTLADGGLLGEVIPSLVGANGDGRSRF